MDGIGRVKAGATSARELAINCLPFARRPNSLERLTTTYEKIRSILYHRSGRGRPSYFLRAKERRSRIDHYGSVDFDDQEIDKFRHNRRVDQEEDNHGEKDQHHRRVAGCQEEESRDHRGVTLTVAVSHSVISGSQREAQLTDAQLAAGQLRSVLYSREQPAARS